MSSINFRSLGLASIPAFLGGTLASGSSALGGLFSQPAPTASSGLPFSAIYSFGDSLSDAGNLSTLTLHTLPAGPYVDGHFTNGPVWVQDLAAQLGLPIPQASLLGGTDFAYGGAETGSAPLHPQAPIDLPSQLMQFTLSHPAAIPHALYTVSVGSNDVLDATAAYSANPGGALADVAQAVGNEVSFISALAADGARDLVVLNVPDLGKTPQETGRGQGVAQIASYLSATYDAQLTASLASLTAADHLNLHLVDAYSLLDQAVANPSAFGLTNVTQPIWTGTYNNPANGTASVTGAAQNSYLFFDNLHPTVTGHEFLAVAAHASFLAA